MKKLVLLSTLILLPLVLKAQIFQYKPIQASYDNESFFYKPSQFNPTDIGSFSNLVPGFYSSNPINKLDQDPSWLPDLHLQNWYAYANVNSRNTFKLGSPGYHYISSSNNVSGHRLYEQPFLSGAILGYPLANKNLFIGFQYQAIVSQNDTYNFTYHSNSLFNFKANNSNGSTNPPYFFEKNRLQQTSQFLTLYTGYRISGQNTIGLRVEAVLFKRNGDYGNPAFTTPVNTQANLLNGMPSPSNLFTEHRSQHYHHIHFDLGEQFIFSPHFRTMIHFGYLVGKGTETLNNTEPSYTESGSYNSGQAYSLNESVINNNDSWSNDGITFNGGLTMQYTVTSKSRLRFIYSGYSNRVGLSPGVRSQVFSLLINQNAQGTSSTQGKTVTAQQTLLHSGDGTEISWNHNLALSYQWSPTRNISFDFGVQLGYYRRRLHSLETSDETGLQLTQTTDTTGATQSQAVPSAVDSTISWSNYLHIYSAQIPFIAHFQITKHIELWGGVNEAVDEIKMKDNIFNPNPVTSTNGSNTTTNSNPFNSYRYSRYHFTVISGAKININNQLSFHVTVIPYDHRYSYQLLHQISGIIWQAGVSVYL